MVPAFISGPLLNVLYEVETFDVVKVPEGYYGQITALDGAAMPEGMFISPLIPDDKLSSMLEAQTFIEKGGIRGSQETVLKPGSYRLNRYLFNVRVDEGDGSDDHSRRPGWRGQIQRPAAGPRLQRGNGPRQPGAA